MAVVNTTQYETEARQFVEFIQGAMGREILDRYGFTTPNED
jgi:ABC-type molybdate transport system substrate-binding protein